MDTGEMPPEEVVQLNRKFKKSIMDVMFNMTDTFYIHCLPNPLLQIGNRGLVDREKADGIVLVFGPYSTRALSWDEQFIHCEMQFGRWERVRIPFECVARMFDKGGHVSMQWATMVSQDTSDTGATKITSASSAAKKLSESPADQGAKNPVAPAAASSGGAAEAKSDEKKSKTDKPRVIEVDFSKKRQR
ncbi:MAG: stringent starvation protein B [Spirochaetia bacterium]|nr:stringent starvation protein B [Spirochaetia bacterium]